MDLERFGHLETVPEDRMVARVLGVNVGTCDGWWHVDGHCIIMPGFIAAYDKLNNIANWTAAEGLDFSKLTTDQLKTIALLVDYYSGEIAVMAGVRPGGPLTETSILAQGQLKVGT